MSHTETLTLICRVTTLLNEMDLRKPNNQQRRIEAMENQPPTFSTERLHLAIYLHASGRLPFLGCLPTGSGRVRFEFSDPDGIADDLELSFEQGASVPANALLPARSFFGEKQTRPSAVRRLETGGDAGRVGRPAGLAGDQHRE